MKVLGFALLLGSLTACSHSASQKSLSMSDYLLAQGARQITQAGDNDEPKFSNDGQRLLFSSRLRVNHKSWQIYEYDFINNRERRVTFSDGDATSPSYMSDRELIYSSTTDEIKERPLQGMGNSNLPPSDIYMSDLYGNEIIRLVNNPGFDSDPAFIPVTPKPYVIFSSKRSSHGAGIYRLDLGTLTTTLISSEKSKDKRFPAISPDRGSLVWVEKNTLTKEDNLVLYKLSNKVPLVLKQGEGQYQSLFFAHRPPQRIFYSILRPGEKQYRIESYNLETQCTQVLFKGKESLYSPSVSNQLQERLAFSRDLQDRRQIYVVPMPQEIGPCLEGTSQANLKE